MANADRPNGFKPVKHLNGSAYNGQARKYVIAVGDGNAAAVGDLVILSDQDAVSGYAAVEPVNAATITAAVVVGAIVGLVPVNESGGVSSGASPTLDTPSNVRRAASTLKFCWVADSPDLLFEAQEDSVSGNIALASVGLNAGFIAALPNTTSGASNFEIDSSSVATTNSLPLQIMEVVNRPDNTVPDTNGRFLVRINTHAYHGTVTAV
jgi:hypothetical protein